MYPCYLGILALAILVASLYLGCPPAVKGALDGVDAILFLAIAFFGFSVWILFDRRTLP